MFERFTNQARRVVVLAQEESRSLNHNYIGTEHLVLGLLREGRGTGARALESLDVTLEAVRGEVETRIGRGNQQQSGHIPFTPRAKKALELSLRESLALGQSYIGTGHLLLGLIRKGDGVGVEILVGLGADLNVLRARVIELLPDDTEEGAESGPRARIATARTERLSGAVQGLLDSIDARLTTIERHLGITRSVPGRAAHLRQADRQGGRREGRGHREAGLRAGGGAARGGKATAFGAGAGGGGAGGGPPAARSRRRNRSRSRVTARRQKTASARHRRRAPPTRWPGCRPRSPGSWPCSENTALTWGNRRIRLPPRD